jgi:hypothetical protein
MASYTRTNARRPPAVVKHSRKVSSEAVGGLDADLKAREAAKRDVGLEGQAIGFLEALTGAAVSDLLRDLKDGVILCNAINAISPKAVRRVNTSKMPFKQMENISNFIKACRALGVPEYALFTTPDLYDGKSVVNVTNGIIALGSKAQSLPGYSGPKIGAKNSTEAPGATTKKKKWTVKAGGSGGVTKMMAGSSGVMERSKITRGRQDMAQAIGAGTAGTSTKMMAGSHGVMQRSKITGGRQDMAQAIGAGTAGTSTKMMAGSSGVMERSEITRGRQDMAQAIGAGTAGTSTKMMAGSHGVMQRGKITGGRQDMAQAIGAGTAGTSTKMMAGSSATMERSAIDTSNSITHAHDANRPLPPQRKAPPPKPKRKVYKTAAWDYVPAEDDELAMTAGDKIEMVAPVDEDWAKGKNTRSGEVGLYPISYVE